MRDQGSQPETARAAAAWLEKFPFYQLTLEPDGLRARRVGWVRLVPVAFLSVWLAGWCLGEVFAVRMLLDLVGDGLLGKGGFPRLVLHDPSTWVVFLPLGFIAFWLVGWTAGGLFAILQAAYFAAGWDHVRVTPSGLEIARGVGPFSLRRTIPKERVTGLLLRQGGKIYAVADSRKHPVLSLRHGDQARQARDHLSALLVSGAHDLASLPAAVPESWTVRSALDGTQLLEPRRGNRALRALVRLAIAGFAGYGLELVRRQAAFLGETAPIAGGFLLVIAVSFLVLAAFTAGGGKRYRVAHGRITRERYFGSWTQREEFAPPRLSLRFSIDSDGDESCALVVQAERRKHRILSTLNDPEAVLQLGRWLEQQTGAPLSLPRELRAA
jgi:hypothetical protein